MICKVLSILILCSFFLLAAQGQKVFAQDLSRTVLPITELKLHGLGIEGRFGTGFCLDPECRFIGSNYHVALVARPRKIKGEKVIQRYFATGPDDEGATVNAGASVGLSGLPLKYTLSRDLAIFELRHSLRLYHGIPFSLDDLEIGQQVDIYAYPKVSINPVRKLLQFHGAFKGETTTGLLAFDYSSSDGKAIHPGGSGGLVVDSKTQQIVGILSGVAKNGEAVALAVPVQSLADFVSSVQPYLAQSIFPSAKAISPASADLYPKFVEPPTDSLQHRSEEPAEVKVLRGKAQILADSMRNFIAVQSFAWGSGGKEPVAQAEYEVQVVDGYQRFREYPDGKKEFQDVPLPPINRAVGTGGEWSELPQMVGTKLGLKIHRAADTTVNGRRIKVFQYHAEVEDGVCVFKSITDFVFFSTSKLFTVPCYGEVWTDEDTNILRMSEHYELPDDKWKDYQGVVTYGRLKRADEPTTLVPLTIYTQAEFKKRVYWCRGAFMNYQVFDSRVKILSGSLTP